MTDNTPQDLAEVLITRAWGTLRRLGITTDCLRDVDARWRLHPEACDDLRRYARGKFGTVDPIGVTPELQWTMFGLTIVSDESLAPTDLRFEVQA